MYQAARAQLPTVYDIIDRLNTLFVSRYNITTSTVNSDRSLTNFYSINTHSSMNTKYNLRPRKPISYKV